MFCGSVESSTLNIPSFYLYLFVFIGIFFSISPLLCKDVPTGSRSQDSNIYSMIYKYPQ